MKDFMRGFHNAMRDFRLIVSLTWLRSRKVVCRHEFRGCDIGRRDETGKLDWACHKCGKVYRMEYGLQASSFGTITGPWGGKPKEER